MRIELTRAGLLVDFADHYTTRGALCVSVSVYIVYDNEGYSNSLSGCVINFLKLYICVQTNNYHETAISIGSYIIISIERKYLKPYNYCRYVGIIDII